MIETVAKINGMACGMCESHINDTVRANFNVKKVSSSFKKGETVILSEEPIDTEKLKQAIGATGYEFVSATSAEYVKKGLFGR